MANISANQALTEQRLNGFYAQKLGLLNIKDSHVYGKRIQIQNAPSEGAILFGSCSYLGLELDSRTRNGAVEAIQRYGTQFSSSRSYVSVPLHEELESLLEQTYGLPVLTTNSTTLAHIAAIPLLIGQEDAVILDQQVHNSVQNAVELLKAKGIHVEYLRHSRMDRLENRIKVLSQQYKHIWYMADGVYSMFGDIAPCRDLTALMDRYENFHCYIDDAHGIAWAGQHGCGQVLDEMAFHPQMILTGSLSKGFGSSGGFIVCPNQEIKQKIRRFGSTMIFSIPVAPAVLGASIAAVKIMQSDESSELQRALQERIQYFIRTAQSLGLPLVDDARTPVFFIGVGTANMGYKISERLIKAGFYANLAGYPIVPDKNTGIRFTVTVHHTLEDIQRMLCVFAALLDEEAALQQVQKQDIFRAFGMKL
ncbi:MAG: hypothetical protein RIS64_3611 [Bacteroidota bacterium]|jgi:7-keto-8-aminopelargonate synthetase-like enzyme